MPDPLDTYREEFKRATIAYCGKFAPCFTAQKTTAYFEAQEVKRNNQKAWRLYVTARALLIAETDGPSAALMWKLAQD